MGFPQNEYPNFTNFPYPSFPQEIPPPDSDPDAGEMICVTYSRSWTAVLMSACSQLTQLSTWEGTDEAKKLAASRATNLRIMLQDDIGCNMGCCYDEVEHRVTSEGGMEIRVNGGDWQPDPEDPRTTATQYPPITFDATHTKCDAAANASVHIQSIISETSSQIGGAGSIVEIAVAITAAIFALFILPAALPALVAIILPLVAGLLFLGQAAWDAYFDDTVDQIILCALYCNIEDNGAFTEAGYAGFLSQLSEKLPGSAAKNLFLSLMARVGWVALNNYAAIGTSESADCSDCDCGCGDLHYFIHAGTLVSQDVDIDGNCVLVVDSEFTGSHHDVQIYWNFSDAPILTHNAHVLGVTVPPKVIGSSAGQVGAYFWRPATNDLVASSSGGLDCGTGVLYEALTSGEGEAFTAHITVVVSNSDCTVDG